MPISVVSPSARGRAKGRQTRSADAGDTAESIVESARRSMAGLQPAEARRDYWNRPYTSRAVWAHLRSLAGFIFGEAVLEARLEGGNHLGKRLGMGVLVPHRTSAVVVRELCAARGKSRFELSDAGHYVP